MLKHKTLLAAAALGTAIATGANAQDATADTVVATVGDTEITLGEVIIARTALPQQYAQFPNEVLFTGLVDQLVQQQLLADVLGEPTSRITYTLANEQRALMAADVITEIAETAITEADIEAAYAARFADAADIPEYNASHILLETEEEAAEAKARVDGGEEFAAVAQDMSTGPTGPNGGNLGWFGQGDMVPEFEDQITTLETGSVSEPFQTQFGWHIARLNETRVQERPTLEDMRRELTAQLQEAAVTARLEELAAETTVILPEEGEFDPAVLDNLELLEE